MQQNSFVTNLMSAQHVSGTIMPIIRSSRLYRWLQHVVHNTVQMENIKLQHGVWWRFVGVVLSVGCGGVLWAVCYRMITQRPQNTTTPHVIILYFPS
jgi:hypothetical protein